MLDKIEKFTTNLNLSKTCFKFNNKAGADRVVTVDLHAGQIQGFFDIPVDNLLQHQYLQDMQKRLK